MKAKNNKQCMCNKQKPMNIFDAGCQVVNHFLNEVKALRTFGVKDSPEPFAIMGTKDYFKFLTLAKFRTVDGKGEDLDRVTKLAHYIVEFHVNAGDIHTIEKVKTKKFDSGQMGWTSVHYPT